MSSNIESEHGQDPSSIERESDQIRADMGRTLDQIEQKLSPREVVDRSWELIEERGGRIVRRLGDAVKENPVPLLLVATGLVWFFASAVRSGASAQSSVGDEEGAESFGDSEAGEAYAADAGAGEEGLPHKLREKAAVVGERLQRNAADLSEKLHSGASAASQRLQSSKRAVKQRLRSTRRFAEAETQRVRDNFSTMLDEQPLVLGAIGVAIGALIGSALPETEYEHRLMGKAKVKSLAKAKEIGAEQYSKLRAKTQDAADAAVRGAKDAIAGRGETPKSGELQSD
jgi:ElaB/YqjD/DUF883 family membrane-anchored ribosome-binding protein